MSVTPSDPTAPLAPGNTPGTAPPVTPGTTPATPAPATPPPAPVIPEPPGEDKISFSSKTLNDRLQRERASLLKSLGFESEEQARTVREQAEATRRASLTREQQLEEENRQLKTQRDEAVTAAAAAAFDAELVSMCAERGIREVSYARYLVSNGGQEAKASMGTFLDEQLKDERKKLAFGIEVPPVQTLPLPIRTTPVDPNTRSPTPAPGVNGQVVNAMNMTPQEFREHEKRYQ